MRRRRFVLAGSVLLAVLLTGSFLLAQSTGGKPKPDPITGTWTGALVREGGSPIPVTMELKFDGNSAVSGTVSGLPNPADVKAGTFDPKTGALKLQLGKQGDSAVLLVLDGTVVKGTATGRVSGDASGEFKIAKKASS
ncbi:MAG: hypothetical protein ABW292_10370 [Vicinamibacterales bacterium]